MSVQMVAVFTIVDYSSGPVIEKIYSEEKVPVAFSTHGHGAADSSVLEYLGFGENKKSVTICLLTKSKADRIFTAAEEKMNLSKPGKGIIFSVPVTSATAFLAGIAGKEESPAVSKESEQKMQENKENRHEHELIVTIITKGCFAEVKAAANSAGARGGTLIHALGMGGEEAQKFLGISIQPEKDIILIVVRREEKNKVMKAIAEASGINTQGKGIIFSLPVDSALGLSEIPYGED
ncbi:MAG: P-II family nitrogen regulator [Ruminiclostridium sp.]